MSFPELLRMAAAVTLAFLVTGAMFLVLIFGEAAAVTWIADRLTGGGPGA